MQVTDLTADLSFADLTRIVDENGEPFESLDQCDHCLHAVGNFDYSFAARKGNESFFEFIRDGIWKWVKPVEWIDTWWLYRHRGAAFDLDQGFVK